MIGYGEIEERIWNEVDDAPLGCCCCCAIVIHFVADVAVVASVTSVMALVCPRYGGEGYVEERLHHCSCNLLR